MSDGENSTGNRKFSDSLSELKEALKDTTELTQEEDSVSTSYAKTHADANVDIARRNLEQDPENPMLRDWLAFNLYASGRYEEAKVLYERCLKENSANADQHYYLGNCLYKLGDIDGAVALWEAVLQIDSKGKCAKKAQDKLNKVKQR